MLQTSQVILIQEVQAKLLQLVDCDLHLKDFWLFFPFPFSPSIWELRFWMNLIDCVTQHDFVDTNFGHIEIWFMFNCQTKGQLLHFSFIQKLLHVRCFCLGPVIEYLFVYTIAQSRTIPAQSPFFTAQFASQNLHNFLFFPHPVRRPFIYALFLPFLQLAFWST